MSQSGWRQRAGTQFTCEKQSAHGRNGMVVTNHPLASAAGMEMLAAGGNAIDAAVAAQFALTVVEPMMVGLIGGTTSHIRLADGSHRIIDGMSAVPLAGHPTMYRPVPGAPPQVYDVERRENQVGPKAVATPWSLRAWCHALDTYGTMPLAGLERRAVRQQAVGGERIVEQLGGGAFDAVREVGRDREAVRGVPERGLHHIGERHRPVAVERVAPGAQ